MTAPRFLLVADQREGVYLVIDTLRQLVMYPRPGDACDHPESIAAAIQAAAETQPRQPNGGQVKPGQPPQPQPLLYPNMEPDPRPVKDVG